MKVKLFIWIISVFYDEWKYIVMGKEDIWNAFINYWIEGVPIN